MTRFASHNPATNEIVWQGEASSPAAVDKAVKSARAAFEKWALYPLEIRQHYLERYAEKLKSAQETIAIAISKETGKPLWESKNEVEAMINKIPLSIESYKARCVEMIRNQPTGKSITRHRPHGVVAVFGPFNFPGHLPNGHIVPALLAGNTVVLKPSELTPLTAELMYQCWQETNLPEGVLNVVQGGVDTGKALSAHPHIDGLFFTGSFAVGSHLAEQFAAQPGKILALEMGGNNPLVITNVSDLDAAVTLTVLSAYLTAGQRCTCARRLIVQRSLYNTFVPLLVEKVATISIGPYTDTPEPFMGPVISNTAAKKVLKAQSDLKALGGKSLVEAKILQPGTGLLSPGLMDVTGVSNRPDEEVFGPFLQIIQVDDLQEGILEANKTTYGLTAGLISDNQKEYESFYRQVRAGVINWNTALTGASSAAPFGGIGRSGNFRPSAYYAADYCSYPVASVENAKAVIPQLKIPITRGSC